MTDWWREFFAEAWPKIQAGGYPAERTTAECDLIQGALAPQPGAHLLDIPCGTGRHAVELARRGFRMTGVDFKPEYVALARAEAAAAGVDVAFAVGDMREFSSSTPFDAAFCFFGSFGYFTEEDDRRFLAAVERALQPGGKFLIDTHIMETLLPIFRERDWHWAGAEDARVQVLEERTWNPITGRADVVWTVADPSGSKSHSTSIRIYGYRDLHALLVTAGFGSVELLDGKTGKAFRMGAPRALVVAEKPLG